MSTHHQKARLAWVNCKLDHEEVSGKRKECEASIAAAQKTLADLEVGVGAPQDVPSWLRRRADFSRRIEVESATLADLRQQEEELDSKLIDLYAACPLAILRDLYEEVGPDCMTARADMHQLRLKLARIFAVADLMRTSGDFSIQKLADGLLTMRDASIFLERAFPTDEDIEQEKPKCRARTAEMAAQPLTEEAARQAVAAE